MPNTVALYDYLVEGPRMGRDEAFVRIPRTKARRERSTSSTVKPGGIRQRKNKRGSW
jgi:hypothetical protein